MEKDSVTNLLLEITRICFKQKITFIYCKDESKKNIFEEFEFEGKKTLRFLLNDPMDEQLEEILVKQLKDLTQ
jgi:hypothetical protein